MKKSLPIILNLIFIGLLAFHFSILFGLIPYDIVWGGKLNSKEEMISFELVSISLNLFFLWISLQIAGWVKIILNRKTIQIILWIMGILFLINTLGNLASENSLETMIFTPMTAFLSLACIYIARTQYGSEKLNNS